MDEALSPIVATGLREAGLDAIHARALGLKGAGDQRVFRIAREQGRVLLSADTDFGRILADLQTRSPSVVLFRRGTERRPGKQVELLLQYLSVLEADLASGALVVFEQMRYRIRKLPILAID